MKIFITTSFLLAASASTTLLGSPLKKVELDSISLSEVVINGDRIATSIKKSPITVSYLPQKEITSRKLSGTTELSGIIPNFIIADYGSRLTSPTYIRGIGSKLETPSVGFFVDFVPYYSKSLMNIDFEDISSVEVFKGPQATSFGRNMMGGAIFIKTISPFEYQGLRLRSTLGSYGEYRLGAGYYHQFSPKLASSLTINYGHLDGYYKNAFLKKAVDRQNEYALRHKIQARLGAYWYLENIAHYESMKQGGYPYAQYDLSTNKLKDISYNEDSYYHRGLFDDALRLSYHKEKLQLQSVTSFLNFNDTQHLDQDFSQQNFVLAHQKERLHQLTEDLSLRWQALDRLSLLSGAYFFYQGRKKDLDIHYFVPRERIDRKHFNYTNWGFALYQEGAIKNIWEHLDITLGLRLDYEEAKVAITPQIEQAGQIVVQPIFNPNAQKSWQLLPKVAMLYDLGFGSLRASLSKGYKAGGFNSTYDKDAPEKVAYKAEYSWNYELGFRSSLWDNLVNADIALFYTDWRNQQIYQMLINSNNAILGQILTNAGHTYSRGVEASLEVNAWKGGKIGLAYGYTEAKYKNNKPSNSAAVDYKNNYIPYVPRHTFSSLIDQTLYIQKPWLESLHLSMELLGLGETFFDDANKLKQKPFATLSASIGASIGNFSLDLWIKNITNERNLVHMFAIPNLTGKPTMAQEGKPRRFGVSLRWNIPN